MLKLNSITLDEAITQADFLQLVRAGREHFAPSALLIMDKDPCFFSQANVASQIIRGIPTLCF